MTATPALVRRSLILGCGSALPQRIMTNADISKVVDTSDDWIVERTGIRARHIANDSETTRTLGTDAARLSEFCRVFPHNILYPGIFLAFTVLAINIMGDGLRDTLDPKMSKKV